MLWPRIHSGSIPSEAIQRLGFPDGHLRVNVAAMWRLALLSFVLALPASAQTDNDTVGRASKPRFQVVDGDTVRFGSQLVTLFGIDAPEKGQTCDDGRWHPGPLAKKALEDFIAGRPVSCRQIDYDARIGRPVAQCYAGDDDLQAMMVSAGWAWSFGPYSSRYAPEERDAVVRKAGVHGHRCVLAKRPLRLANADNKNSHRAEIEVGLRLIG